MTTAAHIEARPGLPRLVHILEDYSETAGGVPAVVKQLSKQMAVRGIHVSALCVRNVKSRSTPPGVPIAYVPPAFGRDPWGWSPRLRREIVRMTSSSEPTVLHVHGIWAAPQYFAASIAKERSIPFVVSAHGMLEPWLWTRQGWGSRLKKQAYWKLLAFPRLNSAHVVHAITPLEATHLRDLFPHRRIEVIPNAIDIPEQADGESARASRERLILFLGRIEPIKGVDLLLTAFAAARIDRGWRVAIVGPCRSGRYEAQLRQIVRDRNIQERVIFAGAAFDDEKLRWLRTSWVMVTPSHSEVIGMVNLEAAAAELPSITTHQTGLDDWEIGGGLLVGPDIAQLARAIETACSWSDEERAERGIASRRLVSRRYSWKRVGPMWLSLYDSLVRKA